MSKFARSHLKEHPEIAKLNKETMEGSCIDQFAHSAVYIFRIMNISPWLTNLITLTSI